MACDYRLHPGQQMVMTLPEGAEVFCAEGRVRIRAAASALVAGFPTMVRELPAGQAWRAHREATVLLEAAIACRWSVELPEVQPGPTAAPHEESLLLQWRRRLAGEAFFRPQQG